MLNCQSIKPSGKPTQLKNMIKSLQADINLGSESWLNSSIKSSEVFPDGFNCYRRDRPGGTGGGVVLLVSKQFEGSEPEELKVDNNTDCKMVWAKVKIQGRADLYIGSIYRPPDKGDQEYLQHLHSRITCIPTDKGAHLWIGGDFNLPDIDWDKENVKPYASKVSLQSVTDHYQGCILGLNSNTANQDHRNIIQYPGAFLYNKCYTYINKVETIPPFQTMKQFL